MSFIIILNSMFLIYFLAYGIPQRQQRTCSCRRSGLCTRSNPTPRYAQALDSGQTSRRVFVYQKPEVYNFMLNQTHKNSRCISLIMGMKLSCYSN